MDFIKGIVENVWIQRAFWSIIVVAFNLIIYRLIAKVLNIKEKKASHILSDKKNKTFIHMLKSVIACILGVLTVLMVLQIYGVNVSSMLAGVGIASIVIGFALQDSLKDIIRGFIIVSDDYYEIGDVIRFDNNVGPVVSVSLLTTKLQDINTMNIISIANRNIDKVEVDPGYVYVSVPMPLSLKVAKAEEIMHEIISKLNRRHEISNAAYQGINDIKESALIYQVVFTCDPANKLQVRRDAIHTIIATLEEHRISIPHEQIDVHSKK